MKSTRMSLLLVLLTAFLISMSGCGAAGSVEGYVYGAGDSNSGMTRIVLSGERLGSDYVPISGASVACTGAKTSARTNASGFFRIDNVRVGKQTLTAVYNSFSLSRAVTIVRDQTTLVNLADTKPLDPKKWTVLVYLASDNDLAQNGFDVNDLKEMEAVGSNNDLNIVVQYDGWSYGDSERLYIKPGKSVALEHLGEVDMSLGSTLEEFVKWGLTNFPAEHTMLVLWNHGGGVWPRSVSGGAQAQAQAQAQAAKVGGKDSGGALLPQGIGWDDGGVPGGGGTWDCLTTDELRIALEGAYEAVPGKKINIIDFDACLMQMYEVCLELDGLTDYIVGSEEVTPGPGNPYDAILGLLAADPDMTAEAYASAIVDEFFAYYPVPAGMLFDGLTQSAIKMTDGDTDWANFKAAVSNFGTALAGLTGNELQAFRDRLAGVYVFSDGGRVENFDVSPVLRFEYRENADLGVLADLILNSANASALPSLQDAAADLLTLLDGNRVVINNRGETGISDYGHGSYEAARGLAIMMPRGIYDWRYYNGADQYGKLKIANTSWWDAIHNLMPSKTIAQDKLTVKVSWANGDLDLYSFEPHGGRYASRRGYYDPISPNGTFSANASSPDGSTTVSETYTLYEASHEVGRYAFNVYCSSYNGSSISAKVDVLHNGILIKSDTHTFAGVEDYIYFDVDVQ